MTMQFDKPVVISEMNASQGIKLGSVRYVLGVSLALCFLAGVILLYLFAE